MSPTTDIAVAAERVRSEAVIKTIADFNIQQPSVWRTILRKIRNVQAPQLEPGQPCAFWRWRKRGLKNRGGWITAKLLTWDPTSPGKLAWVRSGTAGWSLWDNFVRQLPSRSGFLLRATWPPSRTQASFFTGSLWSDESGPAAPEEEALKAQPLHRVYLTTMIFSWAFSPTPTQNFLQQPPRNRGQDAIVAASSWAPGAPMPESQQAPPLLPGIVNNTYVYVRFLGRREEAGPLRL